MQKCSRLLKGMSNHDSKNFLFNITLSYRLVFIDCLALDVACSNHKITTSV